MFNTVYKLWDVLLISFGTPDMMSTMLLLYRGSFVNDHNESYWLGFPSDLGEEDQRQHQDEDLPGTATKRSVYHPTAVGSVETTPCPFTLSLHPSIHPFLPSCTCSVLLPPPSRGSLPHPYCVLGGSLLHNFLVFQSIRTTGGEERCFLSVFLDITKHTWKPFSLLVLAQIAL